MRIRGQVSASSIAPQCRALRVLSTNVWQGVPIIKIERRYDDVTVHVPLDHGKLYAYRLSTTYAEMVTEKDIFNINSGQQRYAIVRAVQMCGPRRLPFDFKSFTLDLELRHI